MRQCGAAAYLEWLVDGCVVEMGVVQMVQDTHQEDVDVLSYAEGTVGTGVEDQPCQDLLLHQVLHARAQGTSHVLLALLCHQQLVQ